MKDPPKTPMCFVLMPFEDPPDRYYKQIYEPAISDAGLKPERADSLFRPSAIIDDIWRGVQESAVLLADLIGSNPNVYYELGLAHAIQKPVVLVAQTIAEVPFDLHGLRVILFDKNDSDWGTKLRESITLSLKETVAEPVSAVPRTFLTRTRPETPAPTENPTERQLRALTEEITALRREGRPPVLTPTKLLYNTLREKLISIDITFHGTPSKDRVERARTNLERFLDSPVMAIPAAESSPKTVQFVLDKPRPISASPQAMLNMTDRLKATVDDVLEHLSVTTQR